MQQSASKLDGSTHLRPVIFTVHIERNGCNEEGSNWAIFTYSAARVIISPAVRRVDVGTDY